MASKKLLGYLVGIFALLGLAVGLPGVNPGIYHTLEVLTVAYLGGQAVIDTALKLKPTSKQDNNLD